MKQEQQELGRLKVEFPIQTRRILILHIVEEASTYASLELVPVLKKPVPLEEALRCEDAAVFRPCLLRHCRQSRRPR